MKIQQSIFPLLLLSCERQETNAFQASRYNIISKNIVRISKSSPAFFQTGISELTQLSSSKTDNTGEEVDLDLLKSELTAYLGLRKERGADDAAKK